MARTRLAFSSGGPPSISSREVASRNKSQSCPNPAPSPSLPARPQPGTTNKISLIHGTRVFAGCTEHDKPPRTHGPGSCHCYCYASVLTPKYFRAVCTIYVYIYIWTTRHPSPATHDPLHIYIYIYTYIYKYMCVNCFIRKACILLFPDGAGHHNAGPLARERS